MEISSTDTSYSPSLDELSSARIDLVTALHKALSEIIVCSQHHALLPRQLTCTVIASDLMYIDIFVGSKPVELAVDSLVQQLLLFSGGCLQVEPRPWGYGWEARITTGAVTALKAKNLTWQIQTWLEMMEGNSSTSLAASSVGNHVN